MLNFEAAGNEIQIQYKFIDRRWSDSAAAQLTNYCMRLGEWEL